jgi:hypothetical protein
VTIRKGEPWGTAVARPPGLVVAGSDAELAELVAARDGRPLAVGGGDLHRTIGSPGAGRTVQRVDVDLLEVEADGVEAIAVAHVIARRAWWRGPIVAVFNAEHLGAWDAAPRSHPNDGRADVIEVDPALSVRQRYQAWRRLPSGTHVPHPHIRVAQRHEVSWRFERSLDLWVDGRRHGRVSELRVTVAPDAFCLHV